MKTAPATGVKHTNNKQNNKKENMSNETNLEMARATIAELNKELARAFNQIEQLNAVIQEVQNRDGEMAKLDLIERFNLAPKQEPKLSWTIEWLPKERIIEVIFNGQEWTEPTRVWLYNSVLGDLFILLCDEKLLWKVQTNNVYRWHLPKGIVGDG